ncbi:protein-disulfide reductase DsbD domain-containing protein [Bartonella sp. LJL80]
MTVQRFVSLCFWTFFAMIVSPFANAGSEVSDDLVATAWHEMEGGRVRIALDRSVQSDTREGVIVIHLKPGWKTYWQNPGNSGMAPFFTFDQNVSYSIDYPTPHLFQTGSDWSIGYKNNVLLPFTLDKTQGQSKLSGSLTLGICEKICIPFNVNFSFSDGNNSLDWEPASLLTLAKSNLPHKAGDDLVLSAIRNGKALEVIIKHPAAMPISELFLDGGDMQIGIPKLVSQGKNVTSFTSDILFDISQQPHQITYIAVSNEGALRGQFTLAGDAK